MLFASGGVKRRKAPRGCGSLAHAAKKRGYVWPRQKKPIFLTIWRGCRPRRERTISKRNYEIPWHISIVMPPRPRRSSIEQGLNRLVCVRRRTSKNSQLPERG